MYKKAADQILSDFLIKNFLQFTLIFNFFKFNILFIYYSVHLFTHHTVRHFHKFIYYYFLKIPLFYLQLEISIVFFMIYNE